MPPRWPDKAGAVCNSQTMGAMGVVIVTVDMWVMGLVKIVVGDALNGQNGGQVALIGAMANVSGFTWTTTTLKLIMNWNVM